MTNQILAILSGILFSNVVGTNFAGKTVMLHDGSHITVAEQVSVVGASNAVVIFRFETNLVAFTPPKPILPLLSAQPKPGPVPDPVDKATIPGLPPIKSALGDTEKLNPK